MRVFLRLPALLLCAFSGAVLAQPAAPQAKAEGPAAPAASAARPHIVVVEDDNVRIEETHVRGGVRSVRVQSKAPGAKAYDVQVAPPGRDPSQEKGVAGKRTWSLFDF